MISLRPAEISSDISGGTLENLEYVGFMAGGADGDTK